ncbi:MAG: hypothetical protein EU547_00795 [Promethearchaeota archaeon]|nr:MAG: hypothetical protein EU547_00795 [Candidatus Lokiarchaeota archaeon]
MAEESKEPTTSEETPKKEPKTKKEPILTFSGPEGASRIITLMAALAIILQGNTAFWTNGVNSFVPGAPPGTNIFFVLNIICGVFLYILGVIIILMIGIVEISIKYLEKIEILEKLYRFEFIFVFAGLTILFEVLSTLYLEPNIPITIYLSVLLGGVLLVIAAILEIIKDKDVIKPSKFVCLFGCGYSVVEAIILFITLPLAFSNYWDGSVAIIVVILLLLSLFEKIKFIPYEWWMVLILGFILWGWVNPVGSISGGGVGGTLVLISFILMLIEK